MASRIRLSKILTQASSRSGNHGRRRHKQLQQQQQASKPRKYNILRGDRVQVVGDHAEAGKQGVVLQVLRDVDRVLVQGVNVGYKNIKGNPDRGIKGRTIQQEKSIPYANVNLVDPIHNQPTRVVRKVLEDGTTVRVSKRSMAVIPRPDVLQFRKRPGNNVATESDTTDEELVWKITYQPKFKSETNDTEMEDDK